MATLVQDCPHCGARHVGFHIEHNTKRFSGANTFNVFGSCPACNGPISAIIYDPNGGEPKSKSGNLADTHSTNCTLRDFFPKRSASKSPEDVPIAAARAFVEGAESLKDGRYTSAVAMFRRTIDVATKEFSDEVLAWNLEKRIDKLAAAGLITKDLQTWAHKIRLEGNEALHELDEPTKEQCTELQLFTELMLTYLFTLPAKVKANIPTDEAE